MQTELNWDMESYSEIDLKVRGLDVYSAHPSTEVLMAAWSFNKEEPRLWTKDDGPFPAELRDALEDPHVIKKAFNAQFERVMARRVLKINTPYKNWQCTQAKAYMLSFVGRLEDVGKQMELPSEFLKDKEGSRLINLFSKPQRVTKANPYRRRDSLTDPDDWERFGEYNIQDVISEMAIDSRLARFEVMEDEWLLYELDQLINDRGLPLNMDFVRNAIEMAARRKRELTSELRELTGLGNPNSPAQMLKWLKARGYKFNDLKKDTVKKALKELPEDADPDLKAAMKLRQQASRTSDRKYNAMLQGVGGGDRIRFCYQFAGASRTNRWAGRRVQTQNMSRTPKALEPKKLPDGSVDETWILAANEAMEEGNYDLISLIVNEPMDAFGGLVRSAIQTKKGKEFRVCDLSSIESVVIGWLADCQPLLNVFREGRDAYKDFAVDLFEKPYEEITKKERGDSKPAVLGCGYRLGGGDLDADGKRTGLWGYAEGMGVDLTKEQAHRAVKVFREKYQEIVQLWYDLENAVQKCLRTGQAQHVGPLRFQYEKPFLTVRLPSGRKMYYFKPRIEKKEYHSRDKVTGEYLYNRDGTPQTYTKSVFSYMGQNDKKQWTRIYSHGGKLVENFVQAIARDILKYGMLNAHDFGFVLIGHVHDEIKTEHRVDDKVHTVENLRLCMIKPEKWYGDMPLNAAGWHNHYYTKD